MLKSNCKQTIAWCFEHGKSFEYDGAIYNINAFGADINLEACACVDRQSIFDVADKKVYYFNPLCDLSSMKEGKKYAVLFSTDKKYVPDVLEVLEKTSTTVYFTNGMCNDLDGRDVSIFTDGHHDILNFNEL